MPTPTPPIGACWPPEQNAHAAPPTPPASDIAVLAIGMDDRKLALLRMAFRLHHSIRYRLLESSSGEHLPDLAIVDIDSPIGWQAWEEFRLRHPELPALIVASTPPEHAPAPTLTKPLRVESLFPQLQAALRPAPIPTRAPATDPLPATAPRSEPAAAPAPPSSMPPISIARFDPRRGLLGATTRLARQPRPALLLVDGRPLLWLRPDRAQAQCLQPAEQLRELCRQDAPALQAQAAGASAGVVTQPLPALLWQLAIWSSQGRLPAGIGADTPLRLRQWPNLTPVGGAAGCDAPERAADQNAGHAAHHHPAASRGPRTRLHLPGRGPCFGPAGLAQRCAASESDIQRAGAARLDADRPPAPRRRRLLVPTPAKSDPLVSLTTFHHAQPR
ncbi:hypothetical protein JOS77_31365 [Chromobacterium haemolyticum]|nr:hypothetical protein JOS77_31365 [Chromobacterium haemolyticum]